MPSWRHGPGGMRRGPSVAYLVLDNFVEGVNTAIASHVPDVDTIGGGWAASAGTWTVVAATDDLRTSDTTCEVRIDAGQDNVDVQCDLTLAASGDAGIAYRYLDTNNHMLAFLDNTNNGVYIYKKVTGSYTSLANTAMTLAGGTYTLRVTVNTANEHTVYVDAVSKVTVTDTTHDGQTKVGIYNSNSAIVADTFSAKSF